MSSSAINSVSHCISFYIPEFPQVIVECAFINDIQDVVVRAEEFALCVMLVLLLLLLLCV